MISYTAEMLNNAINKAVIVELNTGDLLVGYFIKYETNYSVLPLDISQEKLVFKRSQIKKIIYPFSRYILPKRTNLVGKILTMSDLYSLLKKHNYIMY